MRFGRVVRHSVLLAVAYLSGAASVAGAERASADSAYRELSNFARILSYVENNYVAPVTAEALIRGAIRGMLATLDAHSAYLDPAQYAAMKSEAQGEFGGIGVELVKHPNGARIVDRYEGSPAIRAGLEVGDTIAAVDGSRTNAMSLAEIVRRIKGPAGTAVRLQVMRNEDTRPERLRVVREKIRLISVDARRIEDGLAYVRIREFSQRTSRDVSDVIRALKTDEPLGGLVLDLRDNPGGLVDEAVRVADLWLADGTIVSTEGRHQPADRELAHPKGTEPPYPLVVLVNGGTASASEIVAGALQDHGRARILGTQTFGKGSVQTVIELEDQSALKLTIARYFTPKHRSIAGVGITPDVVVPHRPTDPSMLRTAPARSDPQLAAAVTFLRDRLRSR